MMRASNTLAEQRILENRSVDGRVSVLKDEELDAVSGGIIIIGGLQRYELVAQTSVAE
jgi:hypothetical protein